MLMKRTRKQTKQKVRETNRGGFVLLWLALAAQRQRNLEKIEQDEVKVAQELFDAEAKVRGDGPDDPDVIH